MHRQGSGVSPDTIRRPNAMSLDIIRQPHVTTLAAHIRDRARDRAAAAADTHRTAAAAHRPMAAVEVHRLTETEAAIAIQNRLLATAKRQPSLLDEDSESDGQPTVALAAFKR